MIRPFVIALTVALLAGCQTEPVMYGGIGLENGSGHQVRMQAADVQSLAAASSLYHFTPQTETSHFEDFSGRQLAFDFGVLLPHHLAIQAGLHIQTASDGSFRAGTGIDCFTTCRPLKWSTGTDLYEYSLPLQLVGRWNVPRVPDLQWFVSAGASYSFLQIETDVCGYLCQTGQEYTGVHYAKGSNSITPMAGVGLEWRFVRVGYSVRQQPIATGWSGTPGTFATRPEVNLTMGDKRLTHAIGLAFFWSTAP